MSDRARIVVLACCCILLSLGIAVGAGGAASGTVALDDHDNETDQLIHEHPDDVVDDGDEEALAGFLGGALGDRMEEHAISISEGEYERAQELFGDEFDDDLGRFAELEDDLSDDDDSAASEAIEETADQQAEYAELLEEFDRLEEEYEQAVEAGDQERAREIARELVEIGNRLAELGIELETRYELLEELVGADLEEGRMAISNQTEAVNETVETVEATEFEAVILDASVDSTTASYLDPVTVSVTVTDENGTAVDDGTVAVVERPGDVDHSAVSSTETASRSAVEDGEATLSYRPLFQSPDHDAVRLVYRPRADSVFLGNESSVVLDIEQLNATLSTGDVPEPVTYDDSISVAPSITLDEDDGSAPSLTGVPVRGTFAGEEIEPQTEAGEASLAWTVDETTPGGENALFVTVPSGLSIAADGVDQTVTVTTTEAQLDSTVTTETADGTPISDPEQKATAIVELDLETENSEPIDGASVDIVVDGAVVETVQTAANGTAAATVDMPERDGEVVVGATFEPSGGALTDAADETTLTVATATDESGLLGTTDESGLLGTTDESGLLGMGLPTGRLVAVIVAVLAVAASGAYLLVRRRREPSPEPAPEPVSVSNNSTETEQVSATAHIEAVRDELDAGSPDDATVAAYSAVRASVAAAASVDDHRTHWSFVQACRADGLDTATVDALETVTERYEQAAFAPEPVSEDLAEDTVELATSLLESTGNELAPADD